MVIGSSQYTRIVYTRAVYLVERPLKNITLSAEESLIENARQKAQSQNTTLNAEFRRWLATYALDDNDAEQRVQRYLNLMEELSSVRTDGRTFTRDEMNER